MSGRLTKIADKAVTVYIRIVFRLGHQLLLGTLSIDNEMARRRRAEVKFSRARVLRMCDVVKTSSSLRRRLNFSRFSFW